MNLKEHDASDLGDLHRDIDLFATSLLHETYVKYLEVERDRDTGYLATPKRADSDRSNSQKAFDMGARFAFNHAIIAFEKIRTALSGELTRRNRSRGRKED